MPSPRLGRVAPFLCVLAGSIALAWTAAACSDATTPSAGTSSPADATDSGESTNGDASSDSASDAGAAKDGDAAHAPDKYSPVENLHDDALKAALYDMVKGHTALGYDGARDVMFGITGSFDVHNGMLECVYTGRLVAPDGTHVPGGFNTEHSWPQSLGASTEPAHSDLHHIFPVDDNANNERANYPYAWTDCGDAGVAACAWQNAGSMLGVRRGGTETVFEVRPERRGDIARAHFYFSVRYQLPITPIEEGPLREWSTSDPPDALERARNDAIEGYQKNRNPFVDRPEFVDQIADF